MQANTFKTNILNNVNWNHDFELHMVLTPENITLIYFNFYFDIPDYPLRIILMH